MHTEYLQSVRYKLQKRIRGQKSTSFETYCFVLKQLLQFLESEPILQAVQTELAARYQDADSVAQVIIEEGLEGANEKGVIDSPLANEGEWAAVSMGVVRRFCEIDSRTASKFIPMQSSSTYNDHLSVFSDWYLTPFYEYLDERLFAQRRVGVAQTRVGQSVAGVFVDCLFEILDALL
jgi:hypothetical protein